MNLKKLLLFTLIIPLCSCSSNNEELSIITPTGAPALAFYNYSENQNFETNSGDVSNILASMVNNSKDIVVLPTNAGIQAIQNKKLEYKIAATITFGNLYIVSTGNDDNETMDDGDYILLFQKNQLPDLIFHYIYDDSYESNIHYVSSAQEASACLKAGVDLTNNNAKLDYVLLAEPAITSVLKDNQTYKVFKDMQQEYKNKSDGHDMFQASIFVSNRRKETEIKSFLSSIEEDINNGLKNPAIIKERLAKLGEKATSLFGVNLGLIESIIHKIGLGYKNAFENKEAIDKYLSVFNIGETNEEIYFK